LFDAQPQDYRDTTLGTAPRLAIEAAGPFGWGRYVGHEDNMIGVPTFGASASAEHLYEQFGLTPKNIIAMAMSRLSTS
jgi:transketolase